MSADTVALERQIIEFSKDVEQDNDHCFDCQTPHPQWASANNAVFLCIQCAGIHRGFGTHISFVRSLSMDTWKQAQVEKMKLGGNKRFREFIRGYETVESISQEIMSAHELYHSWVATQWREKLKKEFASEVFEPSPPPSNFRPPTPPRQLRSDSPTLSGSIRRPAKGASYSFLGGIEGADDNDTDSTLPFTAPKSKRRKYATVAASVLGLAACGGAFFVLFLGPRGGG